MSNEINVVIESINGESLNDSILNLSDKIRTESGSSSQSDPHHWSIELLEPSMLYCRISEKPGFIKFLGEIGKLQENLTMNYSRFDGSPEPTSDIYRNENGEWLKQEKIMSNPNPNPTETGVKCLSIDETGTEQHQDQVANSFFEFDPNQENDATVEPCQKCGKPATVQIVFRQYLETTTYHLNADKDWEQVDSGTDDGEPDGCWYFCEKCNSE